MSGILSQLPLYLISLPIALLALSLHEASHGYMAYKLGDPTAYNLGRLTLNPLKHLDPIGVLCMVLFRIGWANPVPVSTRNFKKPRRDMALTAAAGPLSNLLSAVVFAALLRLDIFLVETFCEEGMNSVLSFLMLGSGNVPMSIKCVAVLTYMLFIGVVLNISLAIFNLLPIPPFDGSRIAHVFLPPKIYFGIMRYERYIMLAILVLFLIFPMTWLSTATGLLANLILTVFGLNGDNMATRELYVLIRYIEVALSL